MVVGVVLPSLDPRCFDSIRDAIELTRSFNIDDMSGIIAEWFDIFWDDCFLSAVPLLLISNVLLIGTSATELSEKSSLLNVNILSCEDGRLAVKVENTLVWLRSDAIGRDSLRSSSKELSFITF